MIHEEPDCIGAGSYYNLDNEESANESAAQPSVALPVITPVLRYTETRIDPATGERYCLPAIVSDLENPDWYIRIRAAWALGSTRDVEGILPLMAALEDEHKEVRDRAQEALHAMETAGEPLPVRVLLCETVDDTIRTDMLLALTSPRVRRSMINEYGSAREYCERWLDKDAVGLNTAEQVVLASLKRAAAAVLTELSNRSDSSLLLRAGDSNSDLRHGEQLLRSSEPGLRRGEVDNLLLPSSKGTEGT